MNLFFHDFMNLYGRIIGTDRQGNYKVRPDKPGERLVILSDSRKDLFNVGDRINYGLIQRGNYIDFAREYEIAPPTTKVDVATSVKPKSIAEVLQNADVSGVSAIIIYDSSRGIWKYNFVVVAATEQRTRQAIETLYDWGFGGGGSDGVSHYQGQNGLFGGRHHVVRDFRPKVASEPKQNGILFIPVDGALIGEHMGSRHISSEFLRECVESTRLNLEERVNTR